MWWNSHSERLTLWAAGHTMSQPGSGPSPRVSGLCQVGNEGEQELARTRRGSTATWGAEEHPRTPSVRSDPHLAGVGRVPFGAQVSFVTEVHQFPSVPEVPSRGCGRNG